MFERTPARRQGHFKTGNAVGRHRRKQIIQREFAFSRRQPMVACLVNKSLTVGGTLQGTIAQLDIAKPRGIGCLEIGDVARTHPMQRIHQHPQIGPGCSCDHIRGGLQRLHAGKNHVFQIHHQAERRGQIAEPGNYRRDPAMILAVADQFHPPRTQRGSRLHQRQIVFRSCLVVQANNLHIPDMEASIAQDWRQRAAQGLQFINVIGPVGLCRWRKAQIDQIESGFAGGAYQLFRRKCDQAQMRQRQLPAARNFHLRRRSRRQARFVR